MASAGAAAESGTAPGTWHLHTWHRVLIAARARAGAAGGIDRRRQVHVVHIAHREEPHRPT
ncbi:MAG TPA: hypothetical protein VFY14_11400 [Streptomyces sp.]|nr:hypothetical protein [Streptomyces sp.]